MKKLLVVIVFIAALQIVAAAESSVVAFTGVNVIPMDSERVLRNQTVLVITGVIVEIGPKVKLPKGTKVIAAKGKFLIPGLVDMHAHLLSDGDEFPDSIGPDELRVMIANGVTTVRFMIGTPEQLVLRAKGKRGEIVAPTIYVASPQITGREQGNNFVVATPDEAREAVRKSKNAGYDFIKLTTVIEPPIYDAVVDEAKKLGIRVVGHADSRRVGLDRALLAGQQIEHLDSYMEALLRDDSPIKGSVSDSHLYVPNNWESLDYIDESKIPVLAKRTVESNRFVDPTQHFMKNTFGLARTEQTMRAQPDFRFYPKAVQEYWFGVYKQARFFREVPLEKRARWIKIRDRMIKAIYDAGGKIMAGSDTPEFLWLYGFTLHRELRALADAGLPNYAVLEAATRNPSMFFGTDNKVGTIEVGRRADLVLLDANPLDDISNTEKRAGVMLDGRYYPQSELNRWLDEIAPRIAGSYVEKKK